MPVARNLQASPPPSSGRKAQARRQRAELGGWVCFGFFVLALLCLALFSTITEVLGLFGLSVAAVKEKQAKGRIWSEFSSNKLVSIAAEATTGLERWTTPAAGGIVEAGESMAAAAGRLAAEFKSVQDGIRYLQESLPKSGSVGNVVGLVTWDHEQAQASLKKAHAAVEEQVGQVLALARRIIQEHEEFQRASVGGGEEGGNDGGDSDEVAGYHRPAGEEQELLNKLDFGLGEAVVDGILTQLAELEAQIDAAVSTQDAEDIAAQYVVAAVSRAKRRETEGSDEASDEEIAKIVEEVVLSADAPWLLSKTCVSVELARNLTKMELERYGADRTGIPDYAMGLAGARVILSLTSDTYEAPMGIIEKFISKRRKTSLQTASQPPMAINPESRLGMCWPMKGSEGKITVRLSQPINVESVSIEHAPRELLLNQGISAPKDFTVVGYPRDSKIGDDSGDVLVSEGEYRLEGDVIQSWDVAEEHRRVVYSAVALEVDSNHGEGAYTCIYRLRVHGNPAS